LRARRRSRYWRLVLVFHLFVRDIDCVLIGIGRGGRGSRGVYPRDGVVGDTSDQGCILGVGLISAGTEDKDGMSADLASPSFSSVPLHTAQEVGDGNILLG
jgi:hypothetical protein